MKIPPSLQKGDKIAIISTARKISEKEISFALKTFEDWGLEVILGKYLFGADNQFSGTDEERAEDLQWAIDNPEVKAIICARGGYGTVRVIDKINFEGFIQNPKWIVGYSDITVLHNHIHTHCHTHSIHSTMPINFEKNSSRALESLKQSLFEGTVTHECEGHELNRKGSAKGKLIGGNLSILYSLTGTNSDINTDGKILFLEDLDEYLYHMDRMMQNLKKAGKLENLAGLIVGGMTDMNDNETPYGKTALEIIRDAVEDFDFPVCFGFPAGHVDDNRALIFGKNYQLDIRNNIQLKPE